MDFQILPNWFKKLGLALFFIASILTAGDSFMDGWNNVPMDTHHYFKDFYGKTLFHILYILPTLGLLIYMLSKERTEDDFIKLLRLEAYQITVISFLAIAFIFYIIKPETNFSLDWFLSLFMLLFLLVFYIKKQANS
ncbi:hypothetical protein [uncultured Croceitalea sp.]|uniref:hypothetical protein n=1 Tax=uncultured Croceitalea sp. TaxID=1798908 RepID=UPI00374FA9DE